MQHAIKGLIVIAGATLFWSALLMISTNSLPLWISLVMAAAGAGIIIAENKGISIK